jgi:hypothetical protein
VVAGHFDSSDFALDLALDSVMNRGTVATFNHADSSSNWTLFDVTGVLNDGTSLQVIAVPSSPVSSTAAADLKPILSEFAASRSQPSEGGLIPIQPILGVPSGRSLGIGTVAKVRHPETPPGETPPRP